MPQPSEIEIITSAVDQPTALIIGVTGETGTGKTVSAIRLAIGMCRVVGGKPVLIDTNSRRGLHYRKSASRPAGFDFDYIDFAPPFCPLEYKRRIESAISHGARVVIVDTMSDEHNGDGGVMDQVEKWLDGHCDNPRDEKERERRNQQAHARVKPPTRNVLNRYIDQLGRTGIMLILTYRSHDKSKPVTGQGIVKIGYEPETTSTLRFLMTQGFLLLPGDQGKPTVKPETVVEKIWTKSPMQFKGWVTGQQLDEDMGERLARWAAGGNPPTQTTRQAPAAQPRPTSQAPAAQNGDFISEAQRKRFYAIYKQAGWTDEEVKKLLAGYGIAHGNEIPKAKYQEIVSKIELGTAPLPEEEPPFELGGDISREHRDE